VARISCLTSRETPARKIELFEGLAFNPDNISNSARAPRMAKTELQFAEEKTNKSSAKQR